MTIEIELHRNVQWIRLARPPVNALDVETLKRLIGALAASAIDDSVHVVVLGANGKHFCAGVDIREQQAAWLDGSAGPADLGLELYSALLAFPKPLIGMARGGVVGAGLSIIGCCDFSIAAKGTRLSLPEIDVGILGGISHANTVLGKALVNYMALSGMPVAVETLSGQGLFLEVVEEGELESRTSEIASVLAQKHTDAAVFTKRCIRAVRGRDQLTGYGLEAQLSQEMLLSGVTEALLRNHPLISCGTQPSALRRARHQE